MGPAGVYPSICEELHSRRLRLRPVQAVRSREAPVEVIGGQDLAAPMATSTRTFRPTPSSTRPGHRLGPPAAGRADLPRRPPGGGPAGTALIPLLRRTTHS
ncbi:hypothetical protein ACRAWD_25360 [Caulobacter segnis]